MNPTALRELFATLTRDPDVDAPELQAYDATDGLLLSTLADHLAHAADPQAILRHTVIIGDRHGALTIGALTQCGVPHVRVHQDPLLAERALAQNAARTGVTGQYTNHPLDDTLLRDATVVLLQLPRGLEALTDITQAIARWASPDVVVFAGGRDKHMSRGMNTVLEHSFASVSAGLGRRKSRVLTAHRPHAAARLHTGPVVRWGSDPDLTFQLAAYGATFGGPTLDHGTRLLLRDIATAAPQAARVVDVGCGNGVLATAIALARPDITVIATDQSAAAVAAAQLTVDTAGVSDRVRVVRADATEAVPAAWADFILLNPPFHTGATVHVGVGQRLIRACAPALAPGGELRVVANSHLGYRPLIERVIGPTRQVSRDRTFTVYSALRNPSATPQTQM